MGVDPTQLVQLEIYVADLNRSQVFYEQVFGWRTVPADIHGYLVLDVPKECSFGISLLQSSKISPARTQEQRVVLYFEVDDPESIANKATRYGGLKIFGPTSLPAYGSIWQVTDPDGTRFGLFVRGQKAAERQLS